MDYGLYFLDSLGREHLVERGFEHMTAEIAIANPDIWKPIEDRVIEDLKTRRPEFTSYYTRVFEDLGGRTWIDYGSHTEFYILQKAEK